MGKGMAQTFNTRLGQIGSCSFLNYDALHRNEDLLQADSEMQELAREVDALSEEKRLADLAFDERATAIKDRARARVKKITNEKYI